MILYVFSSLVKDIFPVLNLESYDDIIDASLFVLTLCHYINKDKRLSH